MALSASDWSSRTRCTYKTAAVLVCICNIFAVFYVLQLFLTSTYLSSSTYPASNSLYINRSSSLKGMRFSEAQMHRIREAVKVWRAAEPVDLVKRVKEFQVADLLNDEETLSLREKVIVDLIGWLLQTKPDGNPSEFNQEIEGWRQKKLEEILDQNKTSEVVAGVESLHEVAGAAQRMKYILGAGWSSLLEDIGWSEHDFSETDEPEDGLEPEIEDGFIPGPAVPSECHAEPHTDYDGVAVRWGLTFHVQSAADCCQACLDQAKTANSGQMRCNIWVYCPKEAGCYSPDIYEHKHQECWLKQADKPRLNFKGKYSPDYRKSHPTAPVVVPWVAGVTSS